MVSSASARHHLFRKLEDLLGPDDAVTLMDSLPPAEWHDVATKGDLRGGLRELAAELRQEMAEMENRLASKSDLRDLEHRVIEHLDLRVDARLAANQRSTLAWSVAMNATMLGAVIAAIRL